MPLQDAFAARPARHQGRRQGSRERAGNGRLRRAASYTFGIVYRLGALTENRLAYGIMNYNLGTP
jgi:hypothetical protein